MSEEKIDLTQTEEAPKEFVDSFNEIKQSYEQVQETPSEKPKRGRPKKVQDEADVPNPVVSEDAVDKPATQDDGEADAENVENQEKPEESVETETYIPDEFVEAGKARGMKDETIQALFEDSPDFFKGVEPKKEERKPIEQPKAVEDEKFAPIELKLDPELHGKDVVSVVDALVKEVNSLKADAKQQAQKNQAHEVARTQSTISAFKSNFDSTLDKATDDLPGIGVSSKLTSQNVQARTSIWDKAFIFSKGNLPTKDDVDDAVAWYVGRQGKKVIEQQIVSKFKLRAKQIGNAPTHKKPSNPRTEGGEEGFKQEFERIKARYET
jgi:hypothetical protein